MRIEFEIPRDSIHSDVYYETVEWDHVPRKGELVYVTADLEYEVEWVAWEIEKPNFVRVGLNLV